MVISSLVAGRPLLPAVARTRRVRGPPLRSDFLVSSEKRIDPGKALLTFRGIDSGRTPSPFLGARAAAGERSDESEKEAVGEDSAAFDLAQQSILSWVYFAAILGAVLFALNVIWIDPVTGFGSSFVNGISAASNSPEVVMLLLFCVFAVVHSGLASLRYAGEKLVGERAFRVLFAGVSLPLAFTTIVYFINHRYEGTQLWQVKDVAGVHELVWLASLVSFFFLYPSTFNLLEVAAVDKPKMHLWETGIIRITRHPQMVGQVIWCLAHTLWIGNTVAVAASAGLIAHHLFGVWNGDRRLAARHGEAFSELKKRTSVLPFAAILDGRQKLPKDYYKEFIRLPYLAITVVTISAYLAHPLMQASSYHLHW
ncbi:15-cis-zeta-carotene isomerase [Wolffia australiana]